MSGSRRKNRKLILASAVILSVMGASFFTMQTRDAEKQEAAAVVVDAPAIATAARTLIPGRSLSEQDLRWREIPNSDVQKMLEQGAFIARDDAERKSQAEALIGREVLEFLSDNSPLRAAMLAEPAKEIEAQDAELEKGRYVLSPELLAFVEQRGGDLEYQFVLTKDGKHEVIARARPEVLEDGRTVFSLPSATVERLTQLRETGQLSLRLDSRQHLSEAKNLGLSLSAEETAFLDAKETFQLWQLDDLSEQVVLRKLSDDVSGKLVDGRFQPVGAAAFTEAFAREFTRQNVYVLNERRILGLGNGACTDTMCRIAVSAEELRSDLEALRYQSVPVERQDVGLLEQISGGEAATPQAAATPSTETAASPVDALTNGQ